MRIMRLRKKIIMINMRTGGKSDQLWLAVGKLNCFLSLTGHVTICFLTKNFRIRMNKRMAHSELYIFNFVSPFVRDFQTCHYRRVRLFCVVRTHCYNRQVPASTSVPTVYKTSHIYPNIRLKKKVRASVQVVLSYKSTRGLSPHHSIPSFPPHPHLFFSLLWQAHSLLSKTFCLCHPDSEEV